MTSTMKLIERKKYSSILIVFTDLLFSISASQPLTKAIHQTGMTYEQIGQLFHDQVRTQPNFSSFYLLTFFKLREKKYCFCSHLK